MLLGADALFLIVVLANTVHLVVRAARAVLMLRARAFCKVVRNQVVAFQCLYGFLYLLMWGLAFSAIQGVKARVLQATEIPARPGYNRTDGMSPDDPEYLLALLNLHGDAGALAAFLSLYKVMVSLYIVVLTIGTLSVLHVQPRLGRNTQTLLDYDY